MRTARALWILAGAALSLSPGSAWGQATNQITAINPASAPQGSTNLLVTFTLDTDVPPAPPAGVMPNSVMIGTIAGTSGTHSSQYVVSARFNIPSAEPTGTKDAAITFSTPNGTLVFSKAGGFTVTASQNTPPSITQQPQSQTVPVGASATFTVAASGTGPLSYQWQRNDGDISGATSTSFTIDPVAESDAGNYRCVVTNNYGMATSDEAALTVVELPANNYPVVDTGQDKCYDNTAEITCPQAGEAFYGQDAQYAGHQPSYTLSSDGETVFDNVTKLTWMRGPNTTLATPVKADKKTLGEAEAWVATVNAMSYGGFSDWRLPTIKELYSLINFTGTDPSSYTGTDPSVLTPFIDTTYFNFAYGQTSLGERLIDSQYASSTLFVVNPAETGYPKLFGVNFADGRIKGYDLIMPDGITEKTFFVQLVRGPIGYGINGFTDNGDGTVTDTSTDLMWSKVDSGIGMTWQDALTWVQARNTANYLGHNDWRLPNAKELNSLVDYANAPDFNGRPAIDTAFFTCTPITNENGDADFPYYWSSTTHAGYSTSGSAGDQAAYIPFGRALGWPSSVGRWVDVHGAGCQRADSKIGPPFPYATTHVVTKDGVTYTGYAFGPQGDAVRGLNFVRLVVTVAPSVCPGDMNCDGRVTFADIDPFVEALAGESAWNQSHPECPWLNADCNHDGRVTFADIDPFVAVVGTTCP
jgi:hypothetical protein